MICGERFDDEIAMVDTLFTRRLGCGHEVGVDLGSSVGSRTEDDLPKENQGADGKLSAIVVRWYFRVAHEVKQAVKLQEASRLQSCHIRMLADFRIGDEATESDSDAALLRFVSGRLRDKGIGIDVVEVVAESLTPTIRCHLHRLLRVPKEMSPAELKWSPMSRPKIDKTKVVLFSGKRI
jgi:hypothetical protein